MPACVNAVQAGIATQPGCHEKIRWYLKIKILNSFLLTKFIMLTLQNFET
jgi:hypothetical protein